MVVQVEDGHKVPKTHAIRVSLPTKRRENYYSNSYPHLRPFGIYLNISYEIKYIALIDVQD